MLASRISAGTSMPNRALFSYRGRRDAMSVTRHAAGRRGSCHLVAPRAASPAGQRTATFGCARGGVASGWRAVSQSGGHVDRSC